MSRHWIIERDAEGLPERMIWAGDDDMTEDEVVERVAKAHWETDGTCQWHHLNPVSKKQQIAAMKRSVAALRPGDVLGGGKAVYDQGAGVNWTSREKADELARQAAEEMREAAVVAVLHIAYDRNMTPYEAITRAAAAIRALPLEPTE